MVREWVIKDVSEYETNENVRENYWKVIGEIKETLKGFMKGDVIVTVTYEWFKPRQRPAPSPRDDLAITVMKMHARSMPFGVARYRYKANTYAENAYLKVVAWFSIRDESDINRVIEFIKDLANTASMEEERECYTTMFSAIDVAHQVSEALTKTYLYNTKGMDLKLHDSGGDYPEAEFTMLYYG